MSIAQYWNTIKYLKPIQWFYRIKNLFSSKEKQKHFSNIQHKRIDLFIDKLHNNESYLKRFDYSNGAVELLNEKVALDYQNMEKLSPLLQFNLQYFEYAIVWAQKGYDYQFFKSKWLEYLKAKLPLHPYVISLQLVNLIISMGIYGVDDQEIYDELYSRYRWLLKHQEKHLLANHFFENLKAIVIGSYVFNETKIFKKYIKIFRKECQEELLADGVHFELSMMYHKLILEDLLIISRICDEKWVAGCIQEMLTAGFSIEKGFGRTPLFNDSGDNVAKPIDSLVDACKNELNIDPLDKDEFTNAGYYKLYDNEVSVLIDCGPVGPDYNPGHAHCDCLSFELFKDKKPLFVNSGTNYYQGIDRKFYRSTAAHNTITIDGQEQSDCWGEHRVAKRIKDVSGSLDGSSFYGSYVTHKGFNHSRHISLERGDLRVVDRTPKAKEGLAVESYLHLAPGYDLIDGAIVGHGSSYPILTIGCEMSVKDSVYSPEFGHSYENRCIVFSWKTNNDEHGFIIQLGEKETTNG